MQMILFENRNDMVFELVPKNGIYGEIGIFKGDFSKELLKLEPQQLLLFDLFNNTTGSGDVDGNNFEMTNMNEEYNNIKNWNIDCITLYKGDSSTNLNNLDISFDMIYIDGDHSYEGCKRDLLAAFKKVKKGGWIMGHDYEQNFIKTKNKYDFGVKKAVDEFCKKHNLQIHAKAMDGCVSFAIKV
jgi:hypothetical protein